MNRLKVWILRHKRAVIIASSLIVVGAAATGLWFKLQPLSTTERNPLSTSTRPAEPPKPLTKPSPLTGLEVEPELADRTIRAMVIENHTDARPQSALGDAGIVYESLAEGGITRFLAFFGDTRPATIGPIRSLRTYFVDWAHEFDAPVGHAGGNADALDLIGSTGLKSMNQFANGGSYYRTRDRYAPHNLYTSTDRIDDLLTAKRWHKQPSIVTNPRKADSAPATGTAPANPTIKINYSYNGYQVEYRYDQASNSYLRWLAGAPHLDRNTNQQIRVKNVVILTTPTSFGKSRIGEQAVFMTTVGSGKAVILRDGGAIIGTWTKPSRQERTKLLDSQGQEVSLNKGNTWFNVVPPDRVVSY